MSGERLALMKYQVMNRLPLPILVEGELPACPKLTLASGTNQLLFLGDHAAEFESLTFSEICALYDEYLQGINVKEFLTTYRLNMSPKAFALAMPYMSIFCSSRCHQCNGNNFITRAASRSAIKDPTGFYVDYACANGDCDFIVRGNGIHRLNCSCPQCASRKASLDSQRSNTIVSVVPRLGFDDSSRVPGNSPFLKALFQRYVPEYQYKALYDYLDGRLSLEQVQERTGVCLVVDSRL